MKPYLFAIAAICSLAGWIGAQSVVTEPIGFNKVTLLNNSDTIVSIPLRVQNSQSSKLAADPVVNGDAATLTLANSSLTTDSLTTHYIKIKSGTKNGFWYDITSNTGSSVTINLHGDNLNGMIAGDSVLIAEYWTLATLFPPADATSDPATTKHGIVASTSRFASGRLTEVLLPDRVSSGTNLAPNETYYIYNSGWRKQNELYTLDFGATVLFPDTYFIVRHPATVTAPTTFRHIGEVETGSFSIPLATQGAIYQDNFIGLPRPVDVTLNDLGLVPGVFVPSTSRFASGRMDELLVFNNGIDEFNKAPSTSYYYYNGAWRKQNENYTTDFGADVIPAGCGFLIRKAPNGATDFWVNPPNYTTTP